MATRLSGACPRVAVAITALDLRAEAVDEATLINKLLKIEALFAGATTPGEQAAAAHARDRIMERLRVLTVEDPAVEYTFTMPDMWSRKVSLALLRPYELKPYRRHRQRYTTVMLSVPERFVNETLWPEYQRLDDELRRYLGAGRRGASSAARRPAQPGAPSLRSGF